MRNLLILSAIVLLQSCNPTADLSVVDCKESCPNAPITEGQMPSISLPTGVIPTLVNGVAISPITFAITNANKCEIQSGYLPNGLTLNESSCTISGTPTANVSLTGYTVRISAVNDFSVSSEASLTLRVRATISGSATITAQINNAISTYSVTSNQTITSCSFSGTAVPGLNYNTSLCLITGTPTSVGSTVNTITGVNSNGNTNTISVTINVTAIAPVITASTTSVDTRRSSPMSAVTFTSTETISSCSLSGSLPTGISFNSTTCAISGTPSVQTNKVGVNVIVTATGAGGASNSITVNLKVFKNYCDGLGTLGSNSNVEPLNDGNSELSPYILCGTEGLLFLNSNANLGKFFKLQSDIDLGGTPFSATNNFTGNLDGSGHSINNQSTTSVSSVHGLFKTATTATIKNLAISNSQYINIGIVGTLIGQVSAGGNVNISNVVIKNSLVDTETNQSNASGLLVGNVVSGASISLTNILAYNAVSSSSSSARVMIGRSDNSSRTYSGVVYEDSMVSVSGYIADGVNTLNASATPGVISSHTLNDISNEASVYTGFSTSIWNLSQLSINSPPTLVVSKERVYLDGNN